MRCLVKAAILVSNASPLLSLPYRRKRLADCYASIDNLSLVVGAWRSRQHLFPDSMIRKLASYLFSVIGPKDLKTMDFTVVPIANALKTLDLLQTPPGGWGRGGYLLATAPSKPVLSSGKRGSHAQAHFQRIADRTRLTALVAVARAHHLPRKHLRVLPTRTRPSLFAAISTPGCRRPSISFMNDPARRGPCRALSASTRPHPTVSDEETRS